MVTVNEKIKRILHDKLGIDESKLTYDSNLSKDFGVDSLDMVEVAVEIEKEFEISIPDETFEHLKTVGQFTEYVQKTKPIKMESAQTVQAA